MNNKNITVVYYSDLGVDVFHVTRATKEKMQKAFDSCNISSIKIITIEYREGFDKLFKTYFTEWDIKKFLDDWEIDF